MIATVSLSIASSTNSSLIVYLPITPSINVGTKRFKTISLTVVAKVRAGVIIFLPSLKLKADKASKLALEPELTAIPNFLPNKEATFFSNSDQQCQPGKLPCISEPLPPRPCSDSSP